MDKTYQPHAIETSWYETWESNDYFAPSGEGQPYTIMIPPPNVTGSLHMGHGFNNAIMDALIRYRRMQGRNTLWQPGTDHAGIATQMVVERQLGAQGVSRHDLGREKFLEKVWEWKEQSGGNITRQIRRLGSSVDWSRERFTMDDGLSEAVKEAFVRLHEDGLIYRGKRLVNWDTKLHTAISDLEVENHDEKGHLWHLRYPLVKGAKTSEGLDYLVVATTRPETLLGDAAVAVHPEDERYAKLIGQFAELPIVGRRIPIVADEYVDREFGTGCVKITPAHDFNDYEVGKRHDLPLINIFDKNAAVLAQAQVFHLDGSVNPNLDPSLPQSYAGMDRFAARKAIVAEFEAMGLLEKVDDHALKVPKGDRSGTVIEPWLTDQWYVSTKPLAEDAIAAVEDGRIQFVPKQYENMYFSWMRDIQDWCISRQLWWGHRIPAWYDEAGNVYVGRDEVEVRTKHKLGNEVELRQDEDVLDTWFSSGLWTFSTLGWPQQTEFLKTFHPTDVLVTGFDIIFFWVARMMMMGLHFMKEVPFSTVYIHALVRDEKGAKMSKSKGNVIDPLALIDEHGADALRFTLAAMAAQGRDIKLSTQRVDGYRKFANKLWNASRFAEMNGCTVPVGFDPASAKETLNRWIAHEAAAATREVTEALEAYRFNDAANAIYRFVWDVYCDWYVELAKPTLLGEDSPAKAETRAMVAWARDEILKLLHPFMPFITEALWESTAKRDGLLTLSPWPHRTDVPTVAEIAALSAASFGDPLVPPVLVAFNAASFKDEAAEAEIGWVVDLVTAIRSVRAEMNIPPATLMPLALVGASAETKERAPRWSDVIKRLARLSDISFADTAPEGAAQLVVRGEVAALPLKGVVDLAAERTRLAKEIAKADADIERVDKKLGNEKFVANAPEELVEEEKEKREAALARKAKFQDALSRLQGVG